MWTNTNNEGEGNKDNLPFMNTLTTCVNKVVKDGYSDSFKVTNNGLFSFKQNKYYRPEEVKVINFYRFEGQSDPSDNAIMFVLELADGGKGILIDAYGAYADAKVNEFMKLVEDMNKKNTDKDASIISPNDIRGEA